MALPSEIVRDSDSQRESNDCAVKAIALAANVSYIAAHKALQKLGRQRGTGSQLEWILIALSQFGFTLKAVKSPAKTVTTLARHLPRRGRFMVLTTRWRHILTCRSGKVLDWTEGRRYRIQNLMRVTRYKGDAPLTGPEAVALKNTLWKKRER